MVRLDIKMGWKKTLGSKKTSNIFLLILIFLLTLFLLNISVVKTFVTGDKDLGSSLSPAIIEIGNRFVYILFKISHSFPRRAHEVVIHVDCLYLHYYHP